MTRERRAALSAAPPPQLRRELLPRMLLGLNVALMVTAVILALRPSEPKAVAAYPSKAPIQKPTAIEASLPRFPNAASAAVQRRWLVDQLRAMGVPNAVLARLAMKDLDQRWNKYAAEVSLQCRGNPEVLGALNLEIAAKRDDEMRAALGEQGFKEWDTGNMRREVDRGNIELSPAETDVAYSLWKKLQRRDLELRQQKFEGKIDEADGGEAYGKDLAAFQQEMKTLLGATRYAQSQETGVSVSAANLQQDFAAANPTDAQFQELLNTQQQWNDLRAKLARQSQDDATYVQSLKDLDEARDEEYRRVLGADVFDALQKQQDSGYSEMKRYENLWGLDDTKVDYVYGALKYYQKSVEDYQADARALEQGGQKVDWDAVSKNLRQFAQQTQQSLQNYLGQDSLDKLQRNGIVQFNQPLGDVPSSNNGRPF